MRLRSASFFSLITLALVASSASGQTPRDSTMCYKIKPTKAECVGGSNEGAPCRKDEECPSGECVRLPKFVKGITAALDDVLSPGNVQGLDPNTLPGERFTYDIKKVKALCAPAILDDAQLGDPQGITGTHWVMYQIKQAKGYCGGDAGRACKKLDDCISCAIDGPCTKFETKFDKKDPRNTGVRVRDAFNDIRIDFGKEDMLMAPASEDPNGFLAPGNGEFYKCYKVKPTKGVCDSGPLEGEACKRDGDCAPGLCVKPPKFPKETHPDGLSASVVDQFTEVLDPNDPAKTFDVRKIKMFCEAADVKTVHMPLHARQAEQAGLMCYQIKGAKKKCAATSPLNALKSCKKEVDCGGTKRVTQFCVELDPKFDKKDPAVAGRYVQDEIYSLGHRLDVAKEDLLCTPGCRGFGDFELSGLSARVTALGLGLDGNPGNGVDVDGNPATCAPAGSCSGGVDNQLALIAGILNPVLQEELDSSGLNLLFQADDLANGVTVISGFTGTLDDAAPGCAAGDPNDPNTFPVDPGNPADPCNYTANASSFFPDVRSSCREAAAISLPVTISGADTAPTATAVGGGPTSVFELALPFGDAGFTIEAAGVKVDADIVHDTTDIAEISGVLGGAVVHAVLVEAVGGIQDTCFGGPNDQQECDPANIGSCPAPGTCQLSATIPFDSVTLSAFIAQSFPPDLDLGAGGSCRGGSNANEACDVLTDCPDQGGGTVCDPRESISIGLPFTATEAIVTGID